MSNIHKNEQHDYKGTESHRMQVLSRGNLDDITKGSSSKGRKGATPPVNQPGSASSSATAASYANRFGSSIPSLQLLSPEEILENDYDLQLEDMDSSGSEYTTDDSADEGTLTMTGRTSTMFGIPEPLTDRSKLGAIAPQEFDNESQMSEDDALAIRQLALLENEDDDIDVDSEEERDIMAEIRAEITEKVREEMKSELDVYKQAKEKLNKEDKHDPEEGLEGVEPKLKEAILKMRKLDKILEKKIRRERQVKKERIMLTKRLHEELNSIKNTSEKTVTIDEKRNTDKFLSLALPPSHNSGISVENPEREESSPPPVTPVFQTQVPDEGRPVGDVGDAHSTDRSQAGTSGHNTSSRTTPSGATSVSGQSTFTTDSSGNKVKRKKKKDFIKRNIQLASDAANAIAMTDDEKKRVEDLLGDLESLHEFPENDDFSLKSGVKMVGWRHRTARRPLINTCVSIPHENS